MPCAIGRGHRHAPPVVGLRNDFLFRKTQECLSDRKMNFQAALGQIHRSVRRRVAVENQRYSAVLPNPLTMPRGLIRPLRRRSSERCQTWARSQKAPAEGAPPVAQFASHVEHAAAADGLYRVALYAAKFAAVELPVDLRKAPSAAQRSGARAARPARLQRLERYSVAARLRRPAQTFRLLPAQERPASLMRSREPRLE